MAINRIDWVDGWKGFLICLVVVGHIEGGFLHYTSGTVRDVLGFMYRSIYLFHMPAFFMVSGYLWHPKRNLTKLALLKYRINRLVVPYVVWGLVSAMIFIAGRYFTGVLFDGADWYYHDKIRDFNWYRPFLSIIHAGDWPNGDGFLCNSVLWFLPCMFSTIAVYDLLFDLYVLLDQKPCLNRVLLFDIALVIISIGVGAVMRFYGPKYLPWGLSRVPYMLIFFSSGRLLRDTGFIEKVREEWRMLFVLWVVFGYAVWPYADLALGYISWWWYLYSSMVAVLGGILSLFTVRLIVRVSPAVSGVLLKLGITSMGIMLVHKFLILPIHYTYSLIANCTWWLASMLLAVITVIVLSGAYYISKVIGKFTPWALGVKIHAK